MIVLDIETTGVDFVKCGIWQIGAVDLENIENSFLEEARLDDKDYIINSGDKTIFELSGKTEKEFRDKNRQSERQLLENFFRWCKKIGVKNCICQNPQFDLGFIEVKAKKHKLEIPYHYRAFDLHSIAQEKYFIIHGKFLIKEGKSDMGLSNILKLAGMEDNRKEHNALEDSKLTAECFYRIVYGKNLLEEYRKFHVPEYLKK